MAHIRLRKDGRYEGIISFKGKYFSVYERDINKLKTKITKKISELKKIYKHEKTLADTKQDWLTLNGWYNEWLENNKRPFVSPATLKSIKNVFENHILTKLGKIKLKQLDKNKIQYFLNNYPTTRRKEVITTYFKACITQAHKERLIEYNPFDTVITQKKIKSNKVGFTATEQKQLLDYLKTNEPDWYNIILCYLCLGCRRTELFSIKLENIKNGLVLIQGTKTDNSVRYVNITPKFEEILKETISNLKIIDKDWITKKFSKILNQIKLKGSVHSLRHTFATNHYFLGTPAKQVQSWLGHASIQMTLDVYTNINPILDTKTEKELIKNIYNNLYYYTN